MRAAGLGSRYPLTTTKFEESKMNIAEQFTRTVEVLPEEVRVRLDGDAPLDWVALESAGLGADVGRAAAAHHRLPEPVEALVQRLIRDVGMVPADVARGGGAPGSGQRVGALGDGRRGR